MHSLILGESGPLRDLQSRTPCLWLNPGFDPDAFLPASAWIRPASVWEAEARLYRFAPLLANTFGELRATHGIIESPLTRAARFERALGGERHTADAFGRVWVKEDNALPVAGSVKARGGIYAVLSIAERLAMGAGLLNYESNYSCLLDAKARSLLGRSMVSVASTGNLGYSVGITAAKLGFACQVHMSRDAKEWKKKRLRDGGVEVREYDDDYGEAIGKAREAAAGDSSVIFIDDESSTDLFLGYSVAALRLKRQLEEHDVAVNRHHPLFVYLPCGVGGAPSGITYGLKAVFGESVHCFFAEPTESPCALLGLLTGRGSGVSVYEIGLTNRTEADGLAVARMSRLAAEFAAPLVSGCYTVEDGSLYRLASILHATEGIRVELSAAAALPGPLWLAESAAGRNYTEKHVAPDRLEESNHVLWTTGGSLLPEEEMDSILALGRAKRPGLGWAAR